MGILSWDHAETLEKSSQELSEAEQQLLSEAEEAETE